MENSQSNKKISLMIIGVAILVIGLVGITYAFFNYTKTGSLNNVGTGKIAFNSHQGDLLTLTNIFPMTKTEALSSSLDSVEIAISGDTTYSDGEEYVVSIVDVHNTINNKKLPITYLATYEANENKTVGTNSINYWILRNNKNENIFSLSNYGSVVEGEQVLVGYIKSGSSGIDGTLTIKTFIDKDKIAISDSYQEHKYLLKENLTEEELNNCTNYLMSEGYTRYLNSGESLNNFCNGVGTLGQRMFQDSLDADAFYPEDYDYFVSANIVILNEDYDAQFEWSNGRKVFTTAEWDAFESTPISFKIKVESNEGLWAKENSTKNEMINFNNENVFTTAQKKSITEVNFIRMTESAINEHENLIDLTRTNGEGMVKAWIDNNVLYIASSGETYFPVESFGLFDGYTNLTTVNFNNINATEVEQMAGFFYNCSSLTSVDLSMFNTPNLTIINSLFAGCTSLVSVNLKGFITSNVEQMNAVFRNCTSLTSIDLSEFSTVSAVGMHSMFEGCTNLASLDLSNFVTTNVTGMSGMFANCTSLTRLDLSSFDVSNVEDIRGMFANCTNLVTIEVGNNWSIPDTVLTEAMFYGCTSIRGSNNTSYDPDHTDGSYAHVDGGESNHGYLTLKTI